ncbi:MAG: DUF294 nucleotidyltransferase-like domain-containing protein [Bacillota bacterium]|nr:DUF294 nucleotidyltransferase-like domain-containing protein [Bacillota bacterium]
MQAELTALKRTEPFSFLGESDLERLARLLQPRRYLQGEYVVRQGEPAQGVLFLIRAGLAEVAVQSADGGETVVGYCYPGQFFGEAVLLTGKVYPASIRAAVDLDCLLLAKEHFVELLASHPSFARCFAPDLGGISPEVHRQAAQREVRPVGDEEQPTQKRARELMTAPVVSCARSAPVREVAALMADRGVSSVAVLEADGRVAGLVTERDLVEKVLAQGSTPGLGGEQPAESVMNAEPACVSPEDYFYQILLTMVRRRVKHALVVEDGRAVGIVTVRDLVRSRNMGVLSIVGEIENQETVAGLVPASLEVDQVLKAMVAEEAPIPELFSLMTEFYDRLTRKVLELCEGEMAAEGHGPPPSPYCWIVMGSGGRKEQILRTDQDSALIYQEVAPDQAESARQYFLRLADKVVGGLAACGFARCKGNVMASNPTWCRSLPEWRALLSEWIKHPEPEHVRLLSIFLDFRPVHGEHHLAQALRAYVLELISSFPVILRMLAEDDASSPVPLGPWGLVMTARRGPHRGRINLKTAVCVHLVDCLRLLALKHRLEDTSTLGRLKELTGLGIFGVEESAALATAYQSLVFFRVRHHLRLSAAGEEPDEWLDPKSLTKRERGQLVSALKAAARLQTLTAHSFLVY